MEEKCKSVKLPKSRSWCMKVLGDCAHATIDSASFDMVFWTLLYSTGIDLNQIWQLGDELKLRISQLYICETFPRNQSCPLEPAIKSLLEVKQTVPLFHVTRKHFFISWIDFGPCSTEVMYSGYCNRMSFEYFQSIATLFSIAML